MQTTKSTLAVARTALEAAKRALPDYARPKSPKKFTQPQLLACLVVKEFAGKDYRGVSTMLAEWSDLRDVLTLVKIPHFTTLCQAAKRLLAKPKVDRVLGEILAMCREAKILKKQTSRAAIDSTGLETRHVSSYFTRKCKRHKGHHKHRYPKLTAVCDTRNHLILAAVIDRGPKPDVMEFDKALLEALVQQWFTTLLADAGYESEAFHRLCREELGIRSIFPTTHRGRRRADGKPTAIHGKYRKQLAQSFPKKTYGQRWQIETVFSMFKRNLGSALRARTYHSQTREIRLRVLTHNITILLCLFYVLYRARRSPIDGILAFQESSIRQLHYVVISIRLPSGSGTMLSCNTSPICNDCFGQWG